LAEERATLRGSLLCIQAPWKTGESLRAYNRRQSLKRKFARPVGKNMSIISASALFGIER
jgi:hypothetical protein